MNTKILALSLLLLSNPGMVLAADYLVVAVGRTKVAGNECPEGRHMVGNANDAAEAKAKAAAFRQANGLTLSTDTFKRGRAVVVYQFLAPSPNVRCEPYTKFGYASGSDLEDARRSMESNARGSKWQFLSDPQVIRTWTGENVVE